MLSQTRLNDSRPALPRAGRGIALGIALGIGWGIALGIALCWLPLARATAAPPAANPLPAPAALVAREAQRRTAEWRARLPQLVGVWTRADSLRTFDDETIFDYMNGAAELYVGYRFTQLDVCDYTAAELDDIEIEIYSMRSSDDAFGLLSQDWRGEPLSLIDSPAGEPPDGEKPAGEEPDGEQPDAEQADGDRPVPRALYAGGRLRLWSDDMYASLMAYRPGDDAREALIEIGRALVAGRRQPSPPALLAAVPLSLASGLRLRGAQATFLRSHHVLGAIMNLGAENLLELGSRTEVVVATYDRETEEKAAGGGGQEKQASAALTRLLLARYPSPELAQSALQRFRAAHDGEVESEESREPAAERAAVHRDDGWTSWDRRGPCLALVFGCPDAGAAYRCVEQGLERLAALPRSD